MSDVAKQLTETIYQYIRSEIWNEPQREFRRNIKPAVLTKVPVRNIVSFRDAYLELPHTSRDTVIKNTPSYYVFYFPDSATTLINYAFANDWVDLQTLNNELHFELRVSSRQGVIIPRVKCFIRNIQYRAGLVIAVDAAALVTALGYGYDLNQIYITIYRDSDLANDLIISSFCPTTVLEIDDFTTPSNVNYCFVDGVLYPISKVSYQVKHYYEFVKDENIVKYYAMDYNADSPRYDSSYYDEKLLIHIPKAMNANNAVVTHNTCDFLVYNKTQDFGRVITRVYGDNTITQVTHNDFGVDLDILEEYKQSMTIDENDEFAVVVLIRTHNNDNFLVRDANYIYLLYTLSDELIIDFLCGKMTNTLTFWRGSELDKVVM